MYVRGGAPSQVIGAGRAEREDGRPDPGFAQHAGFGNPRDGEEAHAAFLENAAYHDAAAAVRVVLDNGHYADGWGQQALDLFDIMNKIVERNLGEGRGGNGDIKGIGHRCCFSFVG
jgi:hypothetical protein